jgi:hypothetical protein
VHRWMQVASSAFLWASHLGAFSSIAAWEETCACTGASMPCGPPFFPRVAGEEDTAAQTACEGAWPACLATERPSRRFSHAPLPSPRAGARPQTSSFRARLHGGRAWSPLAQRERQVYSLPQM